MNCKIALAVVVVAVVAFAFFVAPFAFKVAPAVAPWACASIDPDAVRAAVITGVRSVPKPAQDY